MSKVDTINALLLKAESTEFPEEAEALTAKAMSLMTTYAISEALLEEAKSDEDIREEIETRIVIVPNPYSMERLTLLQQVAKPMGGYVYFFPQARDGMKVATNSKDHTTKAGVIGYASDLDRIDIMFNSLLRQEVAARRYALQYLEGELIGGMGRKKVWNKSFIRAFSYKVGIRLKKIMQHGIDTYKDIGSVALVFQGRQDALDADIASRGFKRIRGSYQDSTAGTTAGYRAGDRASLSHELER